MNVLLDSSPNPHLRYEELSSFLKKKSKHKKNRLSWSKVKSHIDSCQRCWSIWSRVRWDIAEGKQGYRELEEFLSKDFCKYFDSSWALASDWHEKPRKLRKHVEDFYRNNQHYVYNSVIHYESGDRDDTSKIIKDLIQKYKPKTVIDFGCGVGTDGLLFLEHGVKVIFIDFKSMSTKFLKWRLNKRGYKNFKIIDVDKLKNLPDADMLWTYDVLEHIPDRTKVIEKIPTSVKVFVHESTNDDVAGGRHPFHFSVDEKAFKQCLKKKGFSKAKSDDIEVWQRNKI